ncbi:MAG: OmpA family protein [Desulfobacteraceae bacterium]|nr:OmpA family protein [Desulfobacteraceae bacterium]
MYNYVKKLIAQADKAFANKNYNDAREKAYKGEAKARELEFFAKKEKSRSKIDEFKKSLNKEARTVELTLEESIVGFEYNRDNLKESSLPILSDIAEILKEFSEYRIVIVGHTDSKGTNEYNQKLSERRAQSVLKYMSNQGVKSKRMTIIGYGEDRPIAKNTTPEGRAKNRRVEFRLLR